MAFRCAERCGSGLGLGGSHGLAGALADANRWRSVVGLGLGRVCGVSIVHHGDRTERDHAFVQQIHALRG